MLRVLPLCALFLTCFAVKASAEPKSQFAKFEGHRVHYLSEGKGKDAVVLIHGWTCDATFWSRSMASLAERHRVIAIDLPGHGESDKPEIDYTHDLFVRAVAAVMKDAGVKSAVLIGHSMGGTVARAFLRQNREMVRGLVLVDSPWIPDGGDAEQTKKRENALRSVAEMSKGPNGTAFRQNMVGTMFVKSTPPEVKEQVSKAMLAAPPYVASSAMLGIVAMMVWKPEPVRVPVMIVAAKQQGRGGDRAYLDAFIPELRYEEWEGVGHFLMMEQPERFNALVRSFLASVERR